MSAAELRKAAGTLRERAQNVLNHSGGKDLWFDADVDLRNAIRENFLGNVKSAADDARWISLMSPTVGLALADLLDTSLIAGGVRAGRAGQAALELARLINGDAS